MTTKLEVPCAGCSTDPCYHWPYCTELLFLRADNERLRKERPLTDEELKYGQELIRNLPPDWVLPRLATRARRAEAENERLRADLDNLTQLAKVYVSERERAALETERKAEIWVTDAWLPNSPFLAWCLDQQQRGRKLVALIPPTEAHDGPRYAGYYCEDAPSGPT